jgi:hypothetical protein
MSGISNDTANTAPRYIRRLSDVILIAFHHACDQADLEVAERLLKVVETVFDAPRHVGRERRLEQRTLVAAHERLWLLRHPNEDDERSNVRTRQGRPPPGATISPGQMGV